MKLSIAQRFTAGFSLVVLLLVIGGWISYQGISRRTETATVARRSLRITDDLRWIGLNLDDAAKGEAGYNVSGADSYLTTFNYSLVNINQAFARLHGLPGETTIESPEFNKLETLTSEKLAELQRGIDTRRTYGPSNRQEAAGTPGLTAGLAAIHLVITHLSQGENSRLRERTREGERTNLRITWILFIMTGLGLGTVWITGTAIVRSVTRPIAGMVEVAGKIGEGAWDQPMQSTGNQSDEMGKLDRAFNDMARRLHDREDRLRLLEAVVVTASDAVMVSEVVLDNPRESKIIFVNEAFCRMTGYSREEAMGRSPVRKGPKTDLKKIAEMQRDMLEGKSVRGEFIYYRKDGSDHWIECSVTPIPDEQGIFTRRISIQHDISARKRAEETVAIQKQELEERNRQVENANRLKSRFLASMSHELRTPLNAILGFSELLSGETSGPLLPKQQRFVQHIHTGGAHLLTLINDILDLSKIEAGKIELSYEHFWADGAISEVAASMGPLAADKRLELRLAIEPGLRVHGDRFRFKQILYNLLSNAAKFSPAGSFINIAATGERDFARIVVEDQGIGIRKEDQAVIFDEFRQVGNANSGVKEGTGLGLAITKNLVEQQGGKIWLDSVAGEGSRFFFTIPLGSLDQEPEVPVAPALSGRAENPLLLVVDDELAARELMVSLLAGDGYRVETATCEEEALKKASATLPDVITLDIVMRGGSGWETLNALRANPVTASIPVIIVSVVDEPQRGAAEGANGYLVKPIQKEALLDEVRRVVGISSVAAGIR